MALIDKLSAIASAVREKTGRTDSMTLEEMASAIRGISGGGADNSVLDGLLDGSITKITSGVKEVKDYSFYYCKSLVTVELPNVEEVGDYSFKECTSIKNPSLGTKIKEVGGYAFQGCTALETVNLPYVDTLSKYTFEGCKSLTNINIPLVKSIGTYALRGCTALKSVNLPSVTEINTYAFSGCTALEFLDFSGCSAVPKLSSNNAFKDVPTTCEFRVPSALVDEWKAADKWSTYASQIIGV
jgi:hypothetical protein